MKEFLRRKIIETRDRLVPIEAATLVEFARIVRREGGEVIDVRPTLVRDNTGGDTRFSFPNQGYSAETTYSARSRTGRGIVYFDKLDEGSLRRFLSSQTLSDAERSIRLQQLVTAIGGRPLLMGTSRAEVRFFDGETQLDSEAQLLDIKDEAQRQGIRYIPSATRGKML